MMSGNSKSDERTILMENNWGSFLSTDNDWKETFCEYGKLMYVLFLSRTINRNGTLQFFSFRFFVSQKPRRDVECVAYVSYLIFFLRFEKVFSLFTFKHRLENFLRTSFNWRILRVSRPAICSALFWRKREREKKQEVDEKNKCIRTNQAFSRVRFVW